MLKRFAAFGAALASLLSAAQAQQGSPVSTRQAPAAWVQYAGLLQHQFEVRLADGGAAAGRLRSYLAGTHATGATIAASIWLRPDGTVSKVAFAPFLDSQANADLNEILQGTKLPSSPPSGILLPIHLNLHVAPAPPSAIGGDLPPAGAGQGPR
ncbi:MAG: hypothetical protein WDM91_00325 [Rhizomicrobium sp.]